MPSRGLTFALRLAHRSQDVWAQGFCLQKSAYLAHDLGRDIEGLSFIRMAALCFSEAGDGDDQARVTVDRGYVSYYCGRYDDAERLFRSGLARLGSRLRPFRLAAYQGLSTIERKRGRLREAIGFLENAAAICDGRSLDLGHIRWTQARMYRATDTPALAVDACKEALLIFGEKGQAGDVALVALDLAEWHASSGNKRELSKLAEDLAQWLPSLTENTVIRIAFENFLASLRLGQVTAKALQQTRLAFGKAGIANPES